MISGIPDSSHSTRLSRGRCASATISARTNGPRKNGQCGVGRLTMFVFGTLGYQILPIFYSYFEMHNQMLAIIPKAEHLKDTEVRKRLMGFIKELEIPADSKQLLIDRRDGRLRLRLAYEEVFFIPWIERDIDLYVFPFNIDVEGPY